MSEFIFGVRIFAGDRKSVVDETTSIGLYRVSATIDSSPTGDNNSQGQTNLEVSDTTIFRNGQPLYLDDGAGTTEERIILSITSDTVLIVEAALENDWTSGGTVYSDSQFRWVQNNVSGLSESWLAGMLIPGGLSDLTKYVDLTASGGVATVGGLTVRVHNTAKFWNTIKDLGTDGVYLTGKSIELVLFTDTTETILWRGTCELVDWSVGVYSIAARPDTKAQIANLTHEENANTGEGLSLDIPASLELGWIQRRRFNHFMRDWREDQVKRIDPSVVQDFLEICRAFTTPGNPSDVRINSGYRSQRTNEMLRQRSRNVAINSLHVEGRAIDFTLPGVSQRQLGAVANDICRGGVGTYNTFVHIDSGSNRRWSA
jgi:uncharacterized protein YcbK (DUF882 family)